MTAVPDPPNEAVMDRLGDHAHYKLPGWRDLLEAGGMVRGTRENVRVLMQRGETCAC